MKHNLDNVFQLTALLQKIDVLRYTPAGVPVLDIILEHESLQDENGITCKVHCQLPARLIGQDATRWQHQQGKWVNVQGFLTQKNQYTNRLMLRIQNIQEYKG